MMKQILILLFVLSNSSFLQKKSAQDTSGLAINEAKLEKQMKKNKTFLLDVRTPEEYKAAYIENAVNYNVMDSLSFINTIATSDKNKKYLLYCKSGRRSGKALVMMKNSGFKKLHHLKGGVTEWKGDLNKPE